MDFKGKKLLILGGAGVHCKVVETAKEMGVYTIVADYLTDSPAKRIANESLLISILDVNAIVEYCKKNPVDGILNFCNDPAQKPYQEICERLSLPCYGTREQFNIMTNKRKFKDFCMINGVDVVPEYSEEDILENNVDYPVLIKPSDSRGSRGQTICHYKSDTPKAIAFAKTESSDGLILIEKYMGDKQDVAFAYIVIDGVPYLLKIGDRVMGKEKDGVNTQVLLTLLPSASVEMYINSVEPRVCKMIHALGIEFGPVFIQGFIDRNKETVFFYDPGMRFPGGDYDILLREATGFDTVKTMIRFALTGDTKTPIGNPEMAYLLKGKTAALLTLIAKPGKLSNVQGLGQIKALRNVVYARQILNEGTVIPNSGDVKQRIAAVGGLFSKRKQVSEFIEEVYSTYHAVDENGNDMVISSLSNWHEQ